jgi:hypothetical protein
MHLRCNDDDHRPDEVIFAAKLSIITAMMHIIDPLMVVFAAKISIIGAMIVIAGLLIVIIVAKTTIIASALSLATPAKVVCQSFFL